MKKSSPQGIDHIQIATRNRDHSIAVKQAKTVFLAVALGFTFLLLLALPASAASFSFSTGDPDGKVATLGRVPSPAGIQTETADDFFLTDSVVINQATFIGLIPLGASLSSISQVEVEIYHVFP